MRTSHSRSIVYALCFLFFFIVAGATVHAANSSDPFGLKGAAGIGQYQQTGISTAELVGGNSIIATIIFNILGMVGVIFLILMIWGGVMWMTSGGNEQRVGRAKTILSTATIGLIIVMTAYSVTYFITDSLTNASGNNSCYPRDFVGPLPSGATYCN